MERKSKTEIKSNIAALIGTVVFGFFLLGLLQPDSWWGIHFLNFVSPSMKGTCLVLSVAFLGYAWISKKKELKLQATNDEKSWKTYGIILIGVVLALVFYNMPLAGDIYGNSRGFQAELQTTIKELPSDFYDRLFSFEFVPGNGRDGVTLIVEFISFVSNKTIYSSFRLMDALCGGMFAIAWLWSVNHFIQVRVWKWLLGLIGLSSPFMLIYFGHVETYAPVFLLLFVWLLVFVRYIRTRKATYYFTLIPLLLIGIRLHTLMYLLVPAFAVASVYWFNLRTTFLDKTSNLKGVLKWLYLPMFVGGLILYFFVFQDFNDPRELTNFEDIDRLFLPMESPDPPLDKYNMFSPAHLLDFFNMILFWSPPMLVVLGYVLIVRKKALSWKQREVNMILLTALLFGSILFTMNPLFSMPMDWDLFCFPVPILLLLTLLLVQQIQYEPIQWNVLSSSVGTMILCIPAFSVFLTLKQNSYRTESVGIHIYKTYYEHASTYLLMSLKMFPDSDAYRSRMNNLINELEGHALKGNDKQFAELLVDKAFFEFYQEKNPELARKSLLKSMEYERLQERFDPLAFDINRTLVQQGYVFTEQDKSEAAKIIGNGKRLLREEHEYEKALQEFRYSRYYDPMNGGAVLFSVEALFRMKRYSEAFDFAIDLVALKYPDYKTALRIGIHTALEANRYGDALRYSELFLENFEADETIVTVKQRLEARENVGALKFLFNRGE